MVSHKAITLSSILPSWGLDSSLIFYLHLLDKALKILDYSIIIWKMGMKNLYLHYRVLVDLTEYMQKYSYAFKYYHLVLKFIFRYLVLDKMT